ncbi:MAG: MoaD/ThiS family protein [Capsulimonadaceae bacterium]
MTVHVLFFASLQDAAGAESLPLELNGGATVAACRLLLASRFPRLAESLPRARVAVNLEFVDEQYELADGAEVAFLPAMSGG